MNLTKEVINSLLNEFELFKTNELIEFSIDGYLKSPKTYLKRQILDMSAQVERWDLVMEYIFIHPQNIDFIVSNLGVDIDLFTMKLWNIHQLVSTAIVPVNKMIGFSEHKNKYANIGHNIVVSNFDPEIIGRVDKIKVFW
jgi:hypothetical protein